MRALYNADQALLGPAEFQALFSRAKLYKTGLGGSHVVERAVGMMPGWLNFVECTDHVGCCWRARSCGQYGGEVCWRASAEGETDVRLERPVHGVAR